MTIVRTERGEIIEAPADEGTELSSLELIQLIAQEAAGVELLHAREIEYDNLITELEQKKQIYPEEAQIFAEQIQKHRDEQSDARNAKLISTQRVATYARYI